MSMPLDSDEAMQRYNGQRKVGRCGVEGGGKRGGGVGWREVGEGGEGREGVGGGRGEGGRRGRRGERGCGWRERGGRVWVEGGEGRGVWVEGGEGREGVGGGRRREGMSTWKDKW